VLDEISFQAPDLFKSPQPEPTQEGVVAEIPASAPIVSELAPRKSGEPIQPPAPPLPVIERKTETGTEKVIVIDPEYVRQQIASIVKDHDLSRYIL
jgi:ATP-dependent HslUV protease ATP-binding subunit HslU